VGYITHIGWGVIALRYIHFSSLDYNIWKALLKLYFNDPIEHVYFMYDIIYAIDKTDIYLALSNNDVIGYLLIWKGADVAGVHIWGDAEPLIRFLPTDIPMTIQVYNDDLFKLVVSHLKFKGGKVLSKPYYNMSVNEQNFKLYHSDKAIRLSEKDLDAFIELRKIQISDIARREINRKEALEIMIKWRYYGFYMDNKLVSIACAFVRLNEVWIIGGVFTHPDFRGRGYAKIVTSAITQNALNSGAIAFLQVREDNIPAIRAYKALGYKIIGKRNWIFYNRPTEILP